MRIWLQGRGLRRAVIHVPFLGKTAAGFRRGDNTCPDRRYGKITWAEWVQRKYAAADDQRRLAST